MAKKVFNMQGGRHSAAALSAFINAMYGSSVANGLDVVPTGSTGLNVIVNAGNGNINTGQGFGRLIQLDTTETVALAAASASNPRNDLIVAYIDTAVTPTTAVIDNINDILKFKSVTGTPASVPTDPSGATIQSSVGAGNPYIVLARVRVNTSATSITAGNITDLRKLVTPLSSESSGIIGTGLIADGAITTPKVAAGAIDSSKINLNQAAAAGQTSGATHTVVNDTTFRNISGVSAITITVGPSGKVLLSAGAYVTLNSGGSEGIFINVNATGANTFDTDGALNTTPNASRIADTGNVFSAVNSTRLLTGLTPGSTTFRIQVRSGGGTSLTKTLSNAFISAIAI